METKAQSIQRSTAQDTRKAIYAQIRPAQLKQSVAFYEGKALEALTK